MRIGIRTRLQEIRSGQQSDKASTRAASAGTAGRTTFLTF